MTRYLTQTTGGWEEGGGWGILADGLEYSSSQKGDWLKSKGAAYCAPAVREQRGEAVVYLASSFYSFQDLLPWWSVSVHSRPSPLELFGNTPDTPVIVLDHSKFSQVGSVDLSVTKTAFLPFSGLAAILKVHFRAGHEISGGRMLA